MNHPPTTADLLRFIDSTTRERGIPPSVREIAAAFGIASTSAVHLALNVLADAGYLVRLKGVARGIVLTEKAKELIAEKEQVQ